MEFHLRVGILINQWADAPCLGAAEILGDHAPAGHDDRVILVHILGRRAVFDWVKMGFAVRVSKDAALEEPWGAGMGFRRTGPEETIVLLDPVVRHPCVVNWSACRSPAQLAEDVLWFSIREEVALPEPLRDLDNDLPIPPGMRRRLHCLADAHHPSLTGSHRSLVLFLQGAG